MISLEDEVKKHEDVDLSVAYFSSIDDQPFIFEGVHYYPLFFKTSNTRIKRVIDRLKSFEELDAKMLLMMLDVAKTVQPDLIHIHGTEERFGLIQDYIKDVPIAFSIQGMIAPYTYKFYSGIPQHDAYKLDSIWDRVRNVGIRNDYKSFDYRGKREIEYLKKAKYIFGRTFWDADCTLAINPERKYFTVNEILRKDFYNKCWADASDRQSYGSRRVRIVSIISGGIYKGFETALSAASFLKQWGNIDFEWHVAGYSLDSKWIRICESVSGVKAKNVNFVFHGRLDAGELSSLLCSSDIYVHVSHIENSPNSVCEAMILGMPVIASYAGGTASLLKDEVEGKLYQDGDPYVLAGAIINFVQNFEQAKRCGQIARQTALYRHDPQRIVNELLEAYNAILNAETE